MKLPIPSNASSAHFLPSARERYSSVFPSHFVRTIERASERDPIAYVKELHDRWSIGLSAEFDLRQVDRYPCIPRGCLMELTVRPLVVTYERRSMLWLANTGCEISKLLRFYFIIETRLILDLTLLPRKKTVLEPSIRRCFV